MTQSEEAAHNPAGVARVKLSLPVGCGALPLALLDKAVRSEVPLLSLCGHARLELPAGPATSLMRVFTRDTVCVEDKASQGLCTFV